MAKAHYSLAVLLGSRGKSQDAIEHLSAAVKYQPNYVEAQLALADTWRRSGRADLSLGPYLEAVKINPRASQARLGYAIALASLGRYREARDWLIEATSALAGSSGIGSRARAAAGHGTRCERA